MKTCTIYVVRHGESVHNQQNLLSGHSDPDLTQQGKKQAAVTRAKLKDVQFDEVYSSDLQRAVKTAAIIANQSVPADHQYFELRERNFGPLEGKPLTDREQLYEEHGPVYSALSEEEQWKYKHLPDMESNHEVSLRFVEALRHIGNENAGKTVLVAAHSGTLRTLLVGLGYRTVHTLPPGTVQNAAFVELTFDGKDFILERAEGIPG